MRICSRDWHCIIKIRLQHDAYDLCQNAYRLGFNLAVSDRWESETNVCARSDLKCKQTEKGNYKSASTFILECTHNDRIVKLIFDIIRLGKYFYRFRLRNKRKPIVFNTNSIGNQTSSNKTDINVPKDFSYSNLILYGDGNPSIKAVYFPEYKYNVSLQMLKYLAWTMYYIRKDINEVGKSWGRVLKKPNQSMFRADGWQKKKRKKIEATEEIELSYQEMPLDIENCLMPVINKNKAGSNKEKIVKALNGKR